MQNRNAWMPWLLLATVVVGGWMAWPRPHAPPVPAPAPTAGERAPGPQAAARQPPLDATPADARPRAPAQLPAFLPDEAGDTIALIRRGGPYPHRQDGSVFGNREGHLPRKPRGWYREYTVATPGLGHRGARRIVTGGDPPSEWYYTADHYDSFRRFDVPGGAP
jgi:guanyl-specific ribonuclease Sa